MHIIKKWISEIKRVGFENWLWFVFFIGRNRFSPKLDLYAYSHLKDWKLQQLQCVRDRERANRIDDALSGDKSISVADINRCKILTFSPFKSHNDR